MRKIISAIAAAVMLSFGSNAMATPTGLTGPIETYSPPFGSGHITDVENDLNAYLGVSDVVYLGRLDGSKFDADAILAGTGASISGTGLTGTSGTWTFVQGTTTYEVVGLEINGGSHGALYAVTPWALSGFWDTNDITAGASGNHPALSHLDFYARAVGTTSTPEPLTLSLVGAGLAGIGALRRRAAKKA
jgi:hypothetical protein